MTSARRSASPPSGRPGPVHVSLPSDLLDAQSRRQARWRGRSPPRARHASLAAPAADHILDAIAGAARPLIIAGPQLSSVAGRAMLAKLEAATGVPAVIMESPRGIADATLGAFPDLIRRADLIVLLGKALDFTTRWAAGPAYDPEVRVIAIDPDEALVARARKEKGEHLLFGCVADSMSAGETLAARATKTARARLARRGARRPRQPPGGVAERRRRRRKAGCIPPRCSARSGPSSSAIPTPC